jgi:WD40 repeat protein
VLAAAAAATVLVVAHPPSGAGVPARPPAAAPVDALPAAAPITERTIVGAAPDVGSLVVAELDGTPVLVTNGLQETAVYDLATGDLIGVPLEGGLTGLVATAARIDGRSVLITGGTDGVIRLWDLATGEPLPRTLAGHTATITALTVVDVDGRKVLLSGSQDQTVRRWDLATAAPFGEPLTGIAGKVTALATIRLADRPVVLARGFDGLISSFDVAGGTPVGPPVPSVAGGITPLELPGGPAVLSRPDYGRIDVVDLRSGASLGFSVVGNLLATAAVIGERPLLVDTGLENIAIRDFRTGNRVGAALTGHESGIRSLTTVTVGETTFLISTSSDRSIRIWDLTARARW